MPENNLLNNLIPSGTLFGQIAIGGGTTDYNALENKPSINGVELSGDKSTTDLGLFSGDYNDLTNKPTIPTLPNRYSFVLSFGMNTAAQYITSTDFVQMANNYTYNITEPGGYMFILLVNAEWSQGAYQFYAALDIDGTTRQADNSFAIAQGNATTIFVGTCSFDTTGNKTFKAMAKVSNADKNVKIEPYTTIMGLLFKL